MSAQILSGKEVAAKVLADVKAAVAALGEKTGVHPTLAVILVGEDPAWLFGSTAAHPSSTAPVACVRPLEFSMQNAASWDA